MISLGYATTFPARRDREIALFRRCVKSLPDAILDFIRPEGLESIAMAMATQPVNYG